MVIVTISCLLPESVITFIISQQWFLYPSYSFCSKLDSRQKKCATKRSHCYGRRVNCPMISTPSRRWVTTSVQMTISPPPQSWLPPLARPRRWCQGGRRRYEGSLLADLAWRPQIADMAWRPQSKVIQQHGARGWEGVEVISRTQHVINQWEWLSRFLLAN